MAILADPVDLVKEVGEGFRPTDHELVNHYLKLMILGNHHDVCKIPMVDVYKYEAWDLPYQSGSSFSNYEWYFFCRPHLLKGGRAKRLTKIGYWKSTGKCRKIRHQISKKEIGLKRILVFYVGRTPNGVATSWIMHEYNATLDLPNVQGAIVLYKLIKRANKEATVQTDDSNVLSYNLVKDFEHPIVGSDLPTNYEGHHAKTGCVSNDFDEGRSVSCMAFDSQNQNLHQQTDNSTGCLMIPEIEIPLLHNSILEELDAEILQYLGSPLRFNGKKFSLSPEPDSDVQLFFNNGCESETIQSFPREDDLRSLMTSELENQNQQKADQTTTYSEGEKSRQMICTSENEMANVTKTKEVGSFMHNKALTFQ